VSSSKGIAPGAHVRFNDGSTSEVHTCRRENRQGISDPFISSVIPAGSLFWMFLEPSIVGNLVHHFEIEGVTTAEPVAEPPAKSLEQLQEQLAAAEKKVEELQEQVDELDDSSDGCRGCY